MKINILIIALVLTGCASTSEVIQMGKDTYTVGATVRGFQSHSDARTLGLKKASEYCTSMGKVVSVTNTRSSGVSGWTPLDSEVIFRCLDENDSENQRPIFKKEADTKIEISK